MELTTGTALRADHHHWWDQLCVWQKDVMNMQLRLGTLLPGMRSMDHRAQAEAFQNRAIREQEVIDELQHIVKTHETSLEQKADPAKIEEPLFEDHVELRERMVRAEELHVKLLAEMNAWEEALHTTAADGGGTASKS
jgi:hypothetical protein